MSSENTNKSSKNNNSITTLMAFLSNYSWIIFGLICLSISYLTVWKRGLYNDDYSNRVLAINPISGEVTPFWALPNAHFPMRILTWIINIKFTELIPDYEFLARFFAAMFCAINACLLGYLIYRLFNSKLIGVICVWLFISPIFATETVLWISTTSYIVSAGFALLSVIFSYLASNYEQNRIKFIFVGTLAFTLMMFTFEGCMAAIGVLILINFTTFQQKNYSFLNSIKGTFFNSLSFVVVFVLLSVIFRYSPLVTSRGGVDTSISFLIARICSFFQRTYWLTLSSDRGIKLITETFSVGYDTIVSSFWNSFLFFVAFVFLVITVLTWREKTIVDTPKYKYGYMFLVIGLLWTLSAILIPGIFSKEQVVESRMLYFPTGGLSLAVGSVIWLVTKSAKDNKILIKTFLALSGLILLYSSVIMLGYCQIYAERNRIDQEQLAALTRLLPKASEIPQNTTFVFYQFDKNAKFTYKENLVSNILLFGLFETNWSADDILKVVYKRNDLTAITQNRWADMKFTFDSSNQLAIQGQPVFPEKALFITYKDGNAYLVNQLTLDLKDGTRKLIQFSFGESLKKLPSLDVVEKIDNSQLVQ